ncbi:Camelysin metallo-endopeptidase [Oceanobacillus limi]|uniref:Camelysin metallo-endopeptidase n=1 Tax=Oceanobacillus limi TaxID=930131 RepID=A0A1I0BPR3_9BACI|nr:TasA family protein [Oceanobacillus limi]SET09029.1 Camelysin metallo-endopeptidase [Oceanobacillus limi]
MKRVLILCASIMIVFLIIGTPISTIADESNSNQDSEIDISLNPSDVLFNVDNIKPGDWAPRTITVKNDGKMDFNYSMTVSNEGTDKLFNELVLEINDSTNELYSGKLADFDQLDVRELAASNEEELDITVKFPEHLGNEYQGLEVHFRFIFTAEGTEEADTDEEDEESVGSNVGTDGDSGGIGSVLPDTASGMFNFLLIGSILLASGIVLGGVHILKRKNIDERTV